MIEVLNLSKNYGNKKGVNNLNFKIGKGEIVGLLGVNGAGKTTTMNILSGFIIPDEGKVLIKGIDICKESLKAKENIGYLPEIPPLYPEFTVKSYLEFVYKLKTKNQKNKEKNINDIMDVVNISQVKDRVIKNLSKGYKQRIGIAQALIGNPDILIFDEPTVGLDPKQIIEIRNLIKNIGKEHTVILSSHILAEVSHVCNRVIILNDGKIVAIDTPENLSKKSSVYDKFIIKIKGDKNILLKNIKQIKGIFNVEIKNDGYEEDEFFNSYIIEHDKNIDVKEPLFYMLADNKFIIYELNSLNLNLEEIFLQMTDENSKLKTEDNI